MSFSGADPDPKAEGCEDETYILYIIILPWSTPATDKFQSTRAEKVFQMSMGSPCGSKASRHYLGAT